MDKKIEQMRTAITYQAGNAIIHFLEIEETDWPQDGHSAISLAYERAIEKAKPYGGTRWHNRSYGGGIAFKSAEAACNCMADHQLTTKPEADNL